jgi:hypothetical protein
MKRRFSKRVLVSSPTLGNYISPVPGVESVGLPTVCPCRKNLTRGCACREGTTLRFEIFSAIHMAMHNNVVYGVLPMTCS